jgi:hypothetical protein
MYDRFTKAAAFAVVALSSAAAVVSIGCASHRAAPTGSSPQPAVSAPEAGRPVYRFVLSGGNPGITTVVEADGAIGGIGFGPDRFLVRPDGSWLTAPAGGAQHEEHMMGPVAVPSRLGGGYFFWSDTLYRARTFLGPLEAVAPLKTNVINIAFGHDSILLYGPDQNRRAYALDPPRRVPLSPHGVVDIGGADDDRVLAIDAAGRSLASIDGGKTWKDVSADVGAHPQGILGQPADVAFVIGKDGAWLKQDGSFEWRPLDDAYLPPWAASPRKKAKVRDADRLYRAVLDGKPRADGRVDLAEGNDVVVVDLATGAASEPRRVGPDGSGCVLITTEGEGLATCHTYSVRANDAMAVVSHVLGAAPRVEKSFVHHPTVFDRGGSLVVEAPCANAGAGGHAVAPVSEVVCVRRARAPGTRWT